MSLEEHSIDDTARKTPHQVLCRSCTTLLKEADAETKSCPKCGSRRLITHAELTSLAIAHIDCDAFYASVEKRDRPELADKPVIVGGGQRGVVSTCCYIARMSGVRSAMPMFKALKACPEAVVIKPDMSKYIQIGRDIRERMLSITPLVEPLSIDEAFLDLSGTERLHGRSPAQTLALFAQTIEDDLKITVSVGLSHNKFLAKIASDLDKPRGFAVIGRAETVAFLAMQRVSVIYGIGRKFAQKLEQDGYRTIADLQRTDEKTLAQNYGEIGLRLARLCVGKDSRQVSPERATKSISNEQTLREDLSDYSELRVLLRRLTEKVSARAKASDYCGYRVTMKLKTKDFRTLTRSRTLSDPTNLADRIFRIADQMLVELTNGTAFRLIGVGLSELTEALIADPADLLDETATKRAQAERALDEIKAKIGTQSVETGLTFEAKAGLKTPKRHQRNSDIH